MTRILPFVALAVGFAATAPAQAEEAQEAGIMIMVQPTGVANAAFLGLRTCGPDAPVALRLGAASIAVPAQALHHVVFAKGSGERHPVERAYPANAGCADGPLPVRSAMLTSPIVIALLDPAVATTPTDHALQATAEAGTCGVVEGVQRCSATTEGRTSLSLTLPDPVAPISALCAGPTGAEPTCRIVGQAPDGPAYGVPLADGLVHERSLIAILTKAQEVMRTILAPATDKNTL